MLNLALTSQALEEVKALQNKILPKEGLYYKGEVIYLYFGIWESEAGPNFFDLLVTGISPKGTKYSLANVRIQLEAVSKFLTDLDSDVELQLTQRKDRRVNALKRNYTYRIKVETSGIP